MTFKLYDAATGGNLQWSETQASVSVSQGIFDVILGLVTPFPPLPFDVPYFLSVTVGADPEMTPRQPVTASPYAIRAATSDALATAATVTGSQIVGTIGNSVLPASPSLSGNLVLAGSTATAGNILKGGSRFIHNFGTANTFIGVNAGNLSMTGASNTGSGLNALTNNAAGVSNTATGATALQNNTAGNFNTAIGANALQSNTAGSTNIAIGYTAGINRTAGDFNIDIGNAGIASESNTIRIGDVHSRAFIAGIRGKTTGMNNALPVFIDSDGQLGTVSSSRRFKDNVTDMDAASTALMKLRPVTFYYKTDQNAAGRRLQYGLVAEEVAKVYPGLVAYSADGQIETVMYQFLPPMLLNEFQKQQRTIEKQSALIAEMKRDYLARIDALEARTAEIAALKQLVVEMAQRQDHHTALAIVTQQRGTQASGN